MADWLPVSPAQYGALDGFLQRSPIETIYMRSALASAARGEVEPLFFVAEGPDGWGGAVRCDSGFNFYLADAALEGSLGAFLEARMAPAGALLGRREIVDRLWPTLGAGRTPFADEIQVCLVMNRTDLTLVPPVPAVRQATEADLATVTRLAAAMALETQGFDPYRIQPAEYLDRMIAAIRHGRVYLWEENGQAQYQAFVGQWTPEWGLITDGYTPPEFRGRGIAKRALAAICQQALERSTGLVGLVDEHNHAALRVDAAIGFRPYPLSLRLVLWLP